MDVSQWHQDLGLMKHNMEELSSKSSTTSNISSRPQQLTEKRGRPHKEQALNCPRCNSTNTKFCYYNNYSLTQPRYFCKTCRRYWTAGGSLRNVPVGGGSRKNKKSSSTNSVPTASSTAITTTNSGIANPRFQLPEYSACTTSAMDLLSSSGGMTMNPFMAPLVMSSLPPLAFGVQDFRSNTLSFPLDVSGVHDENSGRLIFPFEESRQVNSNNVVGNDIHKSEQSGGVAPNFWNGMIGGGGGSW